MSRKAGLFRLRAPRQGLELTAHALELRGLLVERGSLRVQLGPELVGLLAPGAEVILGKLARSLGGAKSSHLGRAYSQAGRVGWVAHTGRSVPGKGPTSARQDRMDWLCSQSQKGHRPAIGGKCRLGSEFPDTRMGTKSATR